MPDSNAHQRLQSPVLQLQHVQLDYTGRRSSVRALEDVSFEVAPGEIVALVGESGSGKSTIASAVTGLLPPSARITGGRVLLGGQDVAGKRERAWSRLRGRAVGLVPQDPGASLTPVLTIGAQVAEVLAVRGERLGRAERRRRCIELLEVAEVPRAAERLSQYPHELSGGLKQRILIAMAFGLEPSLVVADEPTSALDVTVQRQVLRVFDRLVREHSSSVLFVTHDIALAADHASRALVLQRGRLVDDVRVDDAVRPGAASGYTGQLLEHARSTLVAVPAQRHEAPDGSGGATSAAPVLEVRGLRHTFPAARGRGEVVAVDDVSFTVPRGQTVALVGESGSGKSTTARAVLRLLDADAGQVLVDGVDVSAASGRARKALWRSAQLVHQNPDSSLDPRWTVARTIGETLAALGLGGAAQRRQRVEELLDAVGLPPEVADRLPAALSGGQRQRVAIARALAPRSSLVVLDEALSALDVITQERVLGLLRTIQADHGVSYLFISHDLATVRLLAQHVVVMKGGRVVEQGPAAQLFAAPQTEYARELLAAVPGHRLLASASGSTAAASPAPAASGAPR